MCQTNSGEITPIQDEAYFTEIACLCPMHKVAPTSGHERKNGKGVAQSDLEKAEEFNCKFTDVFNKNEHTQVPFLDRSAPFMNDIVVSKNGVIKLPKGLNPSNALGPDELHPRVLKELAIELNPIFAHLFSNQLTLVKSQRNGLLQISAPFSRRVTGHLRTIIARFP